MTIKDLDRLAVDAVASLGKESDLGPCSLTCQHNNDYVVAIAKAGPALVATAMAAAKAEALLKEIDAESDDFGDQTQKRRAKVLRALRAALARLEVL